MLRKAILISIAIIVYTAVILQVIELSKLPVMEINAATNKCVGVRLPPDFKLQACQQLDKYEIVYVNK